MREQFRRGYSNKVTMYGRVTDMYETEKDINCAFSVHDETGYKEYPKVIFFKSGLKKMGIEHLMEEMAAGDFVKVEAHMQTSEGYKNSEKRHPYQSIVGDSIEMVSLDVISESKNETIINGYVENIRVAGDENSLVRLTIHTKRAAHDAFIHALVFTDDPEKITDMIKQKDFIYTVGKIQTRRVTMGGTWATYEDIVVKEIYCENSDTHEMCMIYDQKKPRIHLCGLEHEKRRNRNKL